jgi:hypothetical protein
VRALPVCLLVSGCWLAIKDPSPTYVTASGTCIQKEQVGRRGVRYWRDGEELSDADVEHLLAKVPDERRTAASAGHMRRAGWSFLALGAIFAVAGVATLISSALESPNGDVPVSAQAVGTALVAAWFPTMAGGAVLTHEASLQLRSAVGRVNAKGICP